MPNLRTLLSVSVQQPLMSGQIKCASGRSFPVDLSIAIELLPNRELSKCRRFIKADFNTNHDMGGRPVLKSAGVFSDFLPIGSNPL